MEEEKIMAIAEMQCSAYGDPVDNQNPIIIQGDDEQTTELHSLLRLMKISNEFTTIKHSMEIFPLPGNRMEPQHADILCFGPQARNFCQQFQATDLLTSLSLSEDTTKLKIKDLAENAMDEVAKLFAEGEPLWQHDTDRGIEVLNYEEYVKRFSPNLDSTLDEIIRIIAVDAPLDIPLLDNGVKEPKPESSNSYQASREIGYIQLPAICVVEILMDVRLWSFVFSEMLSRAAVLGILSPGALGTYDGALQMMIAEYHAPSPLLQTRKSCFAKYCKEFSRNMWIIVDISLESMIDNPLLNCKRKPSGCLIQGLPDGNTQITWIEHTEAQMESIHPLFNSAVNSGIVLSAKHWVDTLARQCQNLNAMIQQSLSGLQREVSPFNREGLHRIAQRMRREFHGALSATKDNKYKPLPFKKGGDILIRTIEGDAQSPAALITVTTSTRLPFVPKIVFGFLGDEKNRIKVCSMLDVLTLTMYFVL
ncbi:homeobox-leucine zipper protein PROTODERMAL FACTOR 2-like [Silene latifolia]|uniref:homeobox-leucine zipper protein PROTODERMAL FACTOR 2-like n=1 Tax=Silene latifolia TaxID=37657 RepID=UPI003D774BDD